MCIEVRDVHLCGIRVREIDFQQCVFKQEALAVIKAVDDDHNHEHPITVEKDMIIKAGTLKCESSFKLYDRVRINIALQHTKIDLPTQPQSNLRSTVKPVSH
jgi:hypothetical protein